MPATPFDVWGPTASQIDLLADGRRFSMVPRDDGWWTPAVTVAWRDGIDYGFFIDDAAEPVADPRSMRQPAGVHGLSRTFDASKHEWADINWAGSTLAGSLIYELHIGTFTLSGTLDSAIEQLDHLVDLGVTMVELLPVAAFNGAHNWGYDGVLWFAVHEAYGGPAAYQRFVDACHSRGLAVAQDVVYNHLGPSGNVLGQFGPYLGSTSTSWGETVNLDGEGSREVRRYILDNAAMWFNDFHVDALRLDAVHALHDDGTPHLLAELSAMTDAMALELGRPLSLIAESDLNDPVMITPRGLGGRGMTAQWADDYHHAAHVAVTGETFGYFADFDSLGALAKVLRGGFFHDGTFSSFRGRDHGAPIDAATTPSWRLVTCTQNHDQVGNRAAGDRPSQYLDDRSLAIDAVLAMLTPFTPMLFMGQEWGASTPWQFFTAHPEPDLGRAVAEGRLSEFAKMGWDTDTVPNPQDVATFERSRLNWSDLEDPRHQRLLELYRSLALLRRSNPEFTAASFPSAVEFSESERWLWFERGDLAVVINFADDERAVPLLAKEVVFKTAEGTRIEGATTVLPARSAAVVRESSGDEQAAGRP